MLRTNQQAINIIQVGEGLRLKAYLCPAGYPTIGYGHKLVEGEKIGGKIVRLLQNRLNYEIGIKEADALFSADLNAKETTIRALVKVPLNVNQFSALVSFVYNVGEGNLAKSTLLRKLNAGDYAAVPVQLDKWIYQDKQVLGGLKRRRKAEGLLFMGKLT